GFVLTTRLLLNDQLHPLLHGVGIVLLIVGIPLLILGGHFMDLRDKKRRESRSRMHNDKPVQLLLGLVAVLFFLCHSVNGNAQQTAAAQTPQEAAVLKWNKAANKEEPKLTDRERELLERIEQLEKRLAEVEGLIKKPTTAAAATTAISLTTAQAVVEPAP